jgi:hypothetical protein
MLIRYSTRVKRKILSEREKMVDLHDIIVCFFVASMVSGALLLNRFIYPFLFPYLPNWKSAYIASALVFVSVFFGLLFS